MLPIRVVLCPTDFSDPAREALGVASELAAHFSAELILLHVGPDLPLAAAATPVMVDAGGGPGFDVDAYQELVRTQSAEKLAEVAAEVVPRSVRRREVVLQGGPAETIVAAAENEKADLIVIATHGRTRFQRFLFGSVAEKVMRSATCPVLTIRTSDETGA